MDSRMKTFGCCLILLVVLAGSAADNAYPQNPIIRDQFTADPASRVFEGRVYLYPSHDILAGEGRGRAGWFCMEDYHVFSSGNLVDWTDHGVIVSQDKVPWVNSQAYALWAPDCISRNGKYYFYFPAPARDTTLGRGFSIGVAIADKPDGPFTPEPAPIRNARGIDPNPFIDKDGQAYLYWAARHIYVAKLKPDMLELDSHPQVVQGLPDQGLKEGPFVFERNGLYYLTYPHVQDKTERLEYAVSNNPLGPFKVTGVIMDESPECWTNQQSILEFKGQWYLFYHQNDLSPNFDKNRSVRIDSLFFNDDGTIRKVIPTLRGVGVTDASSKIQIDRYSAKSDGGSAVAFLDTLRKGEGWKAILDSGGAWVQYNAVDLGSKRFTAVEVRARSKTGGAFQIRLNTLDGPVLTEMKIPADTDWKEISVPVSKYEQGINNLLVQVTRSASIEIDWLRFK
jgi:hypothetical protein